MRALIIMALVIQGCASAPKTAPRGEAHNALCDYIAQDTEHWLSEENFIQVMRLEAKAKYFKCE